MPRVSIIEPQNSGEAPLAYTLSPGQTIETLAIAADFDGSGASGDFEPAVVFYAADGRRLGLFAAGTTVIAGSSAQVTFFPFAPPASSGGGGSGIQFDTSPQSGDWLEVVTTDTGGTTNSGISLRNTKAGGGGGVELVTQDGDLLVLSQGDGNIQIDTAGGTAAQLSITSDGDNGLLLSDTGPGGLAINESGSGGIFIRNQGAGGLTLRDQHVGSSGVAISSTAADVDIRAAVNILMPTLPAADPGISGALWNNGGAVNVSP